MVKFNKKGIFVGEFGKESRKKKVPGGMGLVHDLAINHPDRLIYVADRENGQVKLIDCRPINYIIDISQSGLYPK